MAKPADNGFAANTINTTVVEAKYDRLMRIYVNKLKLAFVQPEDVKTIEILRQFNVEFAQQTEAIKAELRNSAIQLSKKEVTELYNRISAKSRNEEVIALLFDERITSRTKQNPEIEKLLETLRAKSLEIQNTDLVALTK